MSYFDNHFLFSETYINEFIKDKSKKRDNEEQASNLFKQMRDLYNEYTTGDFSNDPWVDYIDTALDYLGFQKRIHGSSRILYSDSIKEDTKPVATCFMIDKSEDIASTIKGKYYAYDTISETRKNNTNWAILTDGNRWRLYHTKNISPYENYLEINIEESIKNNKGEDEAFKLFFFFFNVKTYYPEGENLIIERIKDESDAKAEIIEDTLRGKAEEILKELCYGLIEDINKESFDEEEKKAIYNDAIILLYRMLFFGYAESRGLLPIVADDPSYTDRFRKICDDAKEIHNTGKVLDIKDGFEYWNRLDEHIRLYVDRSYNGGLFHNEDKPILKEHRISNGRLTKCLAELSYNLDKSGKYIEVIEYKDLSVRNLGSIYEGLLEYRLFIAEELMVQRKSKKQVKYLRAADTKLQNSDLKNIIEKGGIYLSQDALERKETGAYYTPEDVVEYIVDNTVGQRLEELKEEMLQDINNLKTQLSYEPVESRKRIIQRELDELTMKFINEKVLTLSIIDSAMGSGHFLVNAAYRVANEIVEVISNNNWISNDEIIVDISHWKRKVVENCIYGIDINGLSVALARLSLWLISASNDKALSFIDHHLKEGNSIIGTNRRHVEIKDSKYPLFGVSYEEYMSPVLERYEKLKSIGSATKEDVIKQKEIYEEINKILELTKMKYDYYLANQYAGGITDKNKYSNLLRSKEVKDFKDDSVFPQIKFAKEKKFFHWELEFPEVMLNGGFDIAIGNPPYVDVKEDDYKHSPLRFLEARNLYAYMIDNSLQHLKAKGAKLSYIVLISLVCSERMKSLRKYIINPSFKLAKFVNIDSSKNPGTLFNNVIARLVIVNIDLGNSEKNVIETTNYIKFFEKDRKNLFNNIRTTTISKSLIINDILPKIGNNIETSILTKMFNKTRKSIMDYSISGGDNYFFYRDLGATYYCYAFCEPPLFKVNGESKIPTTLSKIYLDRNVSKHIATCIFYSSLFYWFWNVYSDCYHLTKSDIVRFPIDINDNELDKNLFKDIYNEIEKSLNKNGKLVIYNKKAGKTEYFELKPRLSKNVFDKVDRVLADYYGFSQEELTYLINYDIRFRTGEESVEEDE